MTFLSKIGLAAAMVAGSVTAASAFTACQVTDTGGIDDAGFNQTAWKGVEDAMAAHGIEGRFLESQAESDYEANLNSLLGGACDVIVTVGFLMGDATAASAAANPDQKFSIVDFAYDPTIPNVIGQVYATDQAAFLAGYLAAGMSETGVLGTFGGINIPPVTIFMDGFVARRELLQRAEGHRRDRARLEPRDQGRPVHRQLRLARRRPRLRPEPLRRRRRHRDAGRRSRGPRLRRARRRTWHRRAEDHRRRCRPGVDRHARRRMST